MNINQLIKVVEEKLKKKLQIEYLKIEDKSFLHKNHKTNNNQKINLVLLKKIGHPNFNLKFQNKELYSFLNKELIN